MTLRARAQSTSTLVIEVVAEFVYGPAGHGLIFSYVVFGRVVVSQVAFGRVVVIGIVRGSVRIRITGRDGVDASRRHQRVGGPGPLDKVLDGARGVRHGVLSEADRGRVLQPGLLAHLGPDQAGGARQRRLRAGHLAVGAVDRVEDYRLAQIAGDP